MFVIELLGKMIYDLIYHTIYILVNSQTKNSSDLINKIDNLNMENKSLASIHIKLWYTNILVKNCIKRSEVHLKKTFHNLFTK